MMSTVRSIAAPIASPRRSISSAGTAASTEHRERGALLLVAGDLQASDIDANLAEQAAVEALTITRRSSAEDDQVLADRRLELVAVDLDDLLDLLRAGERDTEIWAPLGGRAAQSDHVAWRSPEIAST